MYKPVDNFYKSFLSQTDDNDGKQNLKCQFWNFFCTFGIKGRK